MIDFFQTTKPDSNFLKKYSPAVPPVRDFEFLANPLSAISLIQTNVSARKFSNSNPEVMNWCGCIQQGPFFPF